MPKTSSRLVLVVEDDASVRGPLVKFLELYGFAVVTAETGEQGVEIARTQRIVAAVIDLRLRQGSGHDVVAEVPSETPIIIFSGVPSESGRVERLRPRTRMIEKPYSLVSLVQALEEMIGQDVGGSENLQS
jgi:DNA-binding response OmpR family regulator